MREIAIILLGIGLIFNVIGDKLRQDELEATQAELRLDIAELEKCR